MQGARRKQLKPKMWGVNPTNGQERNEKWHQITTFNDDCRTCNSCLANFVEIIFFWGKTDLAAPL